MVNYKAMMAGRQSGKTLAAKKAMEEEQMTAADAGIPHDTANMGPKFKPVDVTDKRRRKDKETRILKRFRSFTASVK